MAWPVSSIMFIEVLCLLIVLKTACLNSSGDT